MKSSANSRTSGTWNARVFGALCALGACLILADCEACIAAGGTSFSQAKAALRSGEYAKARQSFEAALNENVDREEIRAGLLQTLLETGAYSVAALRADEFLREAETSALLHQERGRIAQASGDYGGAENHFRRSLALAPAGSAIQAHAARLLAELLEISGRRAEARQLWDPLIEQYRSGRVQGSRQLGEIAVAAWHRGYIKDANDIFIDATDAKRGEVSLETLTDFGHFFLEKYDATDAMSVFRDCLKINPSYADALLGVALAKKYDNSFEAGTYAKAALKTNPNLVPARNSLAEMAIEDENMDAAQKEIRAALAVNPSDLETLSLQAVCDHILGNMSDFTATEKKILGINPSYGRLYYTLAENLVSRRKYQEAVDFNRKAIALDSELWPAYASLGMNLTRVGNYEEGRRAIQKAFDGDPHNVWAFNSLELFDQMDTFVASRSPHFTYRISPEEAPILAHPAAALAEEAYETLSGRYGFEPQGPLQIEIFPDHGGFAVRTLGLPGLEGALGVSFGKVVALYSPRTRKADSFNWGSTLWHEFTHVMTLQETQYNIPRWFSEGLSVCEEHKARPGWGDNLSLSFLEAYKEGKLMKVSELNSGFTRPKSPEQISLAYYQAGLVCEWIEERFGFEKIKQSLRLFAENLPPGEVFRRTLGRDVSQMDAEYAQFIDSRVEAIASHLNFIRPEAAALGDDPHHPDRQELERLLRSNPEDFFANLQLGALLKKSGAATEAEIYLKKAKELFPQYVEAGNPYQLLSELYRDAKREDDALAEFLAWSRRDGNAREPLIRAAEIYRNRKDWASAAGMLRLSIYINPYDADAQMKLGEAAMESQQWADSVAAFKAAVELNSTDPAAAHYDLARALLASGNKPESKREILKALEIAPSFIKAQQLLLRIKRADGQ